MKAIAFEDVGRVSVREVPDAVVEEPGDAVIRVTKAAICGSDLHLVHGKLPMEAGETLGHEAAGVVEAVGGDVSRFVPGDRVVAAFVIACGACWFCRNGQSGVCEDFRNLGAGVFGGDLGGAQAELLRVPNAEANLLRIPEGVDDERAMFVGDGLTTAVYGAALGQIAAGDTVAVVGAGPIGLLAEQATRAYDPGDLVILDRDDARLELAREMGMTPVDVREQDPVMALADRTDGRGADVAIEAVGSVEAFESAVDMVRRGGTVSVVGLYSIEQIHIPLGVYWARSLSIRFGGIAPVHAYWEDAMQRLERGELDPTPVVSHRLPLADAAEGYRLFAHREATKVLLTP